MRLEIIKNRPKTAIQFGRILRECRCHTFLLIARQLYVPKSPADIDHSIGNLIKTPIAPDILGPQDTVEIGKEKCGIPHPAIRQQPGNHIPVCSPKAFVKTTPKLGRTTLREIV